MAGRLYLNYLDSLPDGVAKTTLVGFAGIVVVLLLFGGGPLLIHYFAFDLVVIFDEVVAASRTGLAHTSPSCDSVADA